MATLFSSLSDIWFPISDSRTVRCRASVSPRKRPHKWDDPARWDTYSFTIAEPWPLYRVTAWQPAEDQVKAYQAFAQLLSGRA